jgi:type II secretory pathway component PulF
MGLSAGCSPEHAIQGPASSGDRSLGARFHLLAAHLEQGMSVTQALEEVPRLLPPEVVAMLKTGERIGDIRKILPACRRLLGDGVSHVRGALNYLVVLAFVITPFSVAVPLILRVRVIPSFAALFEAEGTGGSGLPAFTRLIFADNYFFSLIQAALLLTLWIALFLYVGGPRVRAWFGWFFPDRELISPWRWKRLQRDFSAMLAVLLDAGVPEAEAVRMAGESTASASVQRRTEAVCAKLKEGVKLTDAIRALDHTGELHWRIANALQRGKGFLQALTGWHEWLDGRAFQLEQTAAQLTTTGLVLVNGVIVGAIVTALFLALVSFLNQAILW